MAFVKTVVRYDAFLYPNKGKKRGRINLHCGTHKLYMIFKDPSDKMPPNVYYKDTKTGAAYQRIGMFPHYLDLVRNEEPIYVTFRPEDTPPFYVVYCAAETPGEGEI